MKIGRRTEYEIYWEILTFCKSGQTFTQIIGRCDLNSKIGQVYLDFLEGKGYISKVIEEGRSIFKTTEKAYEFLYLFSKMYQEIYENSPEFKL